MKHRAMVGAALALALAGATGAGVASTRPARVASATPARVASTTPAIVASATLANTPGCHTYGAVGTSSAAANLPARSRAVRYFVVVTADQVANPPYPQFITFQGLVASYLSATMNPASYNDGPYGGVIEFFDLVNHVPAQTLHRL